MDILSGLGTVGTYMNTNTNPASERVNTSRIKRTPINGNNLYDNSRYWQNDLYVQNVANDQYKLAQNPEKTGVVPNFYNQMKEVDRRKKIAYNEYLKKKKQHKSDLLKQKASQQRVEGFSGDNDSVFSDDKSTHSRRSRHSNSSLNGSCDLNDPMAFFKKGNMMNDTRMHEKKYINQTRENETNGFLSQFEDLAFDNPTDPVSSNNVPQKVGKFGNISKIEMERELALRGNYSNFTDNQDMTYGIVDERNLMHNNMIPSYTSGVGKGYGANSDATKKFNDYKQRKVELFSGSSKSLDYRPKTERRPLFNPQVGLTWIYGTPNFTDYMESRYIPSKERRNELVHQPVRVGPGLNIGYNEISVEGFNDSFRPLPKTVDELRAANNPKISYGSVVIPGMKGEGRRGIIPNVAKHKPEKFKEQDPRDFVKSLGYYRAPSIYGNVDAPSTNRQITTKAWYGPVAFSNDEPRPESMMEKYRLPMRENFLSDTPRNITGVDQEKNKSLTENTYYAKPTNRITTEINGYVNPAAPPGWKQTYAWDTQTNIPDSTRRDTTQNQAYVNPAAPGDWKQTYAWDTQTNIPDSTRRDTTQNRGYVNPAAPGDWKQTYAWDTQTNIPDSTRRDTTQNQAYVNPAAPGDWKQTYAWDTQTNIPDSTRRDTTQNQTYVNPAAPGDWKQTYAWDTQTNIPDSTKRDTTQNMTYIGQADPNEREKGGYQVAVQNTYAPTTIRQLTQNTAQVGGPTLVDGEKGSYQINVQNTYAPTTMRQLTQNVSQLNGAAPTDREKGGYQVAVQNTYAPTTLRQLTQNTTQIGQAGPNEREKGGYQVAAQNTYAPTTLRQLTQNTTQIGQAGPTEREKGGYQVAAQNTYAPTTLRQLTQNTAQLNPAAPNEREKGGYQVAAQNTYAPTTLRQLTQNKSQLNPAAPNEREKGAYQINVQNTTAPTTLRQLTQNKSQLNPAAPNEREKGAYQINVQNTTAPTTLRQLTQNKSQLNPAAPNEREKGAYQINVQNTIAPTTLRQLTQNKTYQGPLVMHEATKTRTRDDAENSLVNLAKDMINVVRDNGAPTTCNYDIGPVYDFTSVQLCEPIEINREVYGQALWQKPLQCMPLAYTRAPNELPQQSWRFDTCVTDCLKSNPFVNNTQHKSVDY